MSESRLPRIRSSPPATLPGRPILPATLRPRHGITSSNVFLPEGTLRFGWPVVCATATRRQIDPCTRQTHALPGPSSPTADSIDSQRTQALFNEGIQSQILSNDGDNYSEYNAAISPAIHTSGSENNSRCSYQSLDDTFDLQLHSQQQIPAAVQIRTITSTDAAAARGQLFEEENNGVWFRRIIPKGNAVLRGYQPATSSNLPEVDLFMLAAYLGKIGNNWSPELRYFKAQRILRKGYTDSAVGMVQLKFDAEKNTTTIFCKVTPETSIRALPYSVELECNFDKILFSRCYGCLAQRGFCKHQLAVAGWIHYRSLDPSCTDIKCYWKKSALSTVDLTLHPSEMTPNEVAADLKSVYVSDGSFLQKLRPKILQMRVPSMLRSQMTNTLHPLDLHNLLFKFCSDRSVQDKSVGNFKTFVSKAIDDLDPQIWKETKAATKDQSSSSLWKLLRYGRITASTLATVAGCGKDSSAESVVRKLFGAEKLKPTAAMVRGLEIEDAVRAKFALDRKRKVERGHFLMHRDYPLFGASPDGIGSDFIIEIKSPKENKNTSNYLKVDGSPNRKVMLQILLQLKLSGRKRAYLLIPDERFEVNSKYKTVIVDFDEDSLEPHQQELGDLLSSSVQKAEDFFKKHMFFKMIERFRDVLV